jgi:hypothetical protein
MRTKAWRHVVGEPLAVSMRGGAGRCRAPTCVEDRGLGWGGGEGMLGGYGEGRFHAPPHTSQWRRPPSA